MDSETLIVAKSRGSRLIDKKGRSYVDYGMAMGANLVGHAHPVINEACIAALEGGSMCGFRHDREEQAGEALARVGGRLSKVTFVTTGTEAVHLACRIARGATGRPLVCKTVGGYDGWLEELRFGLVGSPETERRNDRPVRDGMTLVRVNDFDDLEQLFIEKGSELAAILIEPMLGNTACLVPERAWFEMLNELADKHGIMIIADEVMVGLRLGVKLVSETLGLKPDLVTMGKAIGSGVPVAAVLGTPEAFKVVESNRVSRFGTYHGNPLVTAAVKATIELLESSDYEAGLFQFGREVRRQLPEIFAAEGITVSTSGFDSVYSLWFAPEAPRTYDEALRLVQVETSRVVYEVLRRNGVVALPSPWGRYFVSFAHDSTDLDITLNAFRAAARKTAEARSLS
ncbi:MAG: aminotransferase class III-fold pyridoxal phosphate-dependent enzyme [Dehalococcoidia bacterium]